MSINRAVLTGRLTRDPQQSATQSGTSVLEFGLAVNERRRNARTGEWEDYANFVECAVFGKRADALARLLSKGVKVVVDGHLRYASWERDGKKRSKLSVIVEEIDLMSTVPRDSVETPSAEEGAESVEQASVYDEDIPF